MMSMELDCLCANVGVVACPYCLCIQSRVKWNFGLGRGLFNTSLAFSEADIDEHQLQVGAPRLGISN